MSFDKDYPNRKDWRKPYYDSRNFDWTCRNHGSCDHCCNKRQFRDKRRQPLIESEDYYVSDDERLDGFMVPAYDAGDIPFTGETQREQINADTEEAQIRRVRHTDYPRRKP